MKLFWYTVTISIKRSILNTGSVQGIWKGKEQDGIMLARQGHVKPTAHNKHVAAYTDNLQEDVKRS